MGGDAASGVPFVELAMHAQPDAQPNDAESGGPIAHVRPEARRFTVHKASHTRKRIPALAHKQVAESWD